MEQQTEERKTRYVVGQKLYVIHFAYEGREDFGFTLPFMFDQTPISKINIIELTVTEHHKVKNEYSRDEDEATCDGFILTDKEGNIWHNQYPRASYGQVSDEGDRRFTRHLENESQYQKWLDEGVVFECRLLSDVFGKISRGIKHFAEIDPKASPTEIERYKITHDALEKCLDEITTVMKNDFQKELKEVPIWEKYPNITHFVLQDIPKEVETIAGF